MRWLGIRWLVAIFAFISIAMMPRQARSQASAPTDGAAWKNAYLLSRAGDAYAKGKKKEAESLFRSLIASDPPNEIALLHLAALARAAGRKEEQLEFLQTAASAHPMSYPVQHELGATLLESERAADAVAPLQAALAANPKSLDAAVNLGDAYSLIGKLDDAHTAYATAIGIDASSAWAHRQFGYCLLHEKKPNEAIAELERAARTMSDDSALFLNLGHLYNQLGNDASALAAYVQVTKLSPHSSAGYMFAGNVSERLGRREDAERYYRAAITAKVTDPLAHVYLGNLRQTQGDVPGARAQYEAALASAPENAWALTQLGFLLVRMGEPVRAEKLLTRALALAPRNLDIEITLGDLERLRNHLDAAAVHYRRVLSSDFGNLAANIKLADVMRLSGDPKGALAMYKQATSLAPKSAWAWISLADCETALGLPDAEAHYRAALVADPHSLWATRQLGYWLFAHDRWEEARAALETARGGYPQDGNIVVTLGHIAKQVHPEDPQIAATLYRRAVAIEPKNARARMFLADSERQLGHSAKALSLFQEAVAIDPTLLDAWVLLGDAAKRDADAATGAAADTAHALAQSAYEHALGLDPHAAWPARQLGFLAFADERWDTAQTLLEAASAGYPRDREIFLTLGHLALKRKDLAAAVAAYTQAVAVGEDSDIRPLVFLGIADRQGTRLEDSLTALTHATALAPHSAWAHAELAATQFAAGRIDAATATIRTALIYAPKDREALLFLARLRHLRLAFGEAITLYRHVLDLYPGYAPAELGLSTALTDRGRTEDLIDASRYFAAAMEKLPTTIFTELVAGHLYAHIAEGIESGTTIRGYFKLPADLALDAHAIALAHLRAALALAEDDDSVRLAVANSLVSMKERTEAQATLAPVLAKANGRCPKSEWDLTWQVTQAAAPQPASAPTDVSSATADHLVASAELLAGDLEHDINREAPARLHYACAIAIEPSLVMAHLRLGLAYENESFVRLAEEHYLVVLRLEPDNANAQLGVARLRKQSGLQLTPIIRVAGDVAYRSDALAPEALARNALVFGPKSQDLAFTVPRSVTATATGDFVVSANRAVPHVEAEASLFQDTGSFLSDQLKIESRYGAAATVRAVGSMPYLGLRESEVSYTAQETVTYADATTRGEVRTLTELAARWAKFQLGVLAADLNFEHGIYYPQGSTPLLNATSNALFGNLNLFPELRRYHLEPMITYHAEGLWLLPTQTSYWAQSLLVGTNYLLQLPTRGQAMVGGSLRFAATAGDLLPPGTGTLLSYTVHAHGGYNIGQWLLLDAHLDVQGTPALTRLDNVAVGGDAGVRWMWPRVPGITHTGFYFSAGYAARLDYNAGRVDHLIMGSVSFAR
jgi:tetratricopeptide (TPR) repeat protein